jgi:glycogen synthase
LWATARCAPSWKPKRAPWGFAAQVRMPGIAGMCRSGMAAADVFALPSRWEGLPMVLL